MSISMIISHALCRKITKLKIKYCNIHAHLTSKWMIHFLLLLMWISLMGGVWPRNCLKKCKFFKQGFKGSNLPHPFV